MRVSARFCCEVYVRGRITVHCRRNSDTQVELLTDRNQKLAKVEGALASTPDGHSILRGTVTLD